jgi:hypothetical protein
VRKNSGRLRQKAERLRMKKEQPMNSVLKKLGRRAEKAVALREAEGQISKFRKNTKSLNQAPHYVGLDFWSGY